MHAVIRDHNSPLATLSYNGADVDAVDNFYKTALVKAVYRGKFECTVLLFLANVSSICPLLFFMILQGLSVPFACVGSGDPVRVLRLYTMNTLDTL